MHALKLPIAALLLACSALPAPAATWIGNADYGVESVGPFNTYDFASAGVLLLDPQVPGQANGYYQSFVAGHQLDGLAVAAPQLAAGNYEITVVAAFGGQLTSSTPFGQTFAVQTGGFALYLGALPNRNFTADSGFTDGIKILEGVIETGAGSVVSIGSQQFGGGALNFRITGYDAAVFEPDTIGGAESTFSLRLNSAALASFIDPITAVQGHAFQPAGGDLKYAVDGNLVLTPIPEPSAWAMTLAGIALIGGAAGRRARRA